MATKTNLVIDQGSTFSVELNLTDDNGDPLGLVGYTATSQLRKWYTSSNSPSFATEIDTDTGVVTLSLSEDRKSTRLNSSH